jgi:hypothetical protein
VKWRETDAIAVNIREYLTCIPMWADIMWSWDLGVESLTRDLLTRDVLV